MKAWDRIRQLLLHRSARLGVGLIALFFLAAVFAPWLSPVDPLVTQPDNKLLPPMGLDGGVWPHLLGTDALGRDVFARLLHGARVSLSIGIISVGLGLSLGVPLGLISGFLGGRIDALIMRAMDVLLAFPSILLAICIVAVLGPSLTHAMIAVGLISVPTYSRIVRASVLSERSKEYVLAERALGKAQVWTLLFSILPNILAPILVVGTLGFASAVLEAAGLSFIGLGAEPPTPEWGALLLEGKEHFHIAWWLMLFPGLAIIATVVGFNLVGDGLRDVLDPRAMRRGPAQATKAM